MNKYINLAMKEAKKSIKHKDVPVGVVIVKNNKIIAKAHNMRERRKLTTAHAEIIAINKACKRLKSWHLNDCDIYVTLEPCLMCYGAIAHSRINKLVYGINNEKFGCVDDVLKMNDIQKGVYKINETLNLENAECKTMIQEFFKKKRK